MSATTKTPYPDIHPVAVRLLEAIRPYCHRVELAGSLRRRGLMIGDIEIVAVPIPRLDLFGQETDGPTALDEFLDGYARLFDTAREHDVAIVVGGQALTADVRQRIQYASFCDTVRQLEQFALSLRKMAK